MHVTSEKALGNLAKRGEEKRETGGAWGMKMPAPGLVSSFGLEKKRLALARADIKQWDSSEVEALIRTPPQAPLNKQKPR